MIAFHVPRCNMPHPSQKQIPEKPRVPEVAPDGPAKVAYVVLIIAFLGSLLGSLAMPVVGIPIAAVLFATLVLLSALYEMISELRRIRWNLELRRWLDDFGDK